MGGKGINLEHEEKEKSKEQSQASRLGEHNYGGDFCDLSYFSRSNKM